MSKSELKNTINITMYIIYKIQGISLSTLRVYLIYLKYLNVIKYPDDLDEVFFRKLFDSKYIAYINRRSKDIGMVSGFYVVNERVINFHDRKIEQVDGIINKLKTIPYMRLLEDTTSYNTLNLQGALK